MLVLMRRAGEEISIPSLGVSIKIVSTQGGRTRIGINAPAGLAIRRAEVKSEDFRSCKQPNSFPSGNVL